MTTKCSELHAGFAKKENDLLAKVSNAETNIQQLQNISSKYHATRHELETTNQEHKTYLNLLHDKDRSINQLQTEIRNIRDENTKLNENVTTLRSKFAITSEENRKLMEKVNVYKHQEHNWKQQLETLKEKANIDAAERGRQMELRVDEQQKKHIEEVKQIQLKYENSVKLASDANLRDQNANETIQLLEEKLRTLELTIIQITDDHKQKIQDLSEKLSVSLSQINELKTLFKDTKASEGNLNRHLNERDQELEQFKELTKNQDSQLIFFEEKIAENEHQLQQANEQQQHFNKEIQNLKQELHQTKSKLKESVKSYEALDNAQRKSTDNDLFLRQLNELKAKEKELAAEIHQLRLKLKDSNNELGDTKTRLSKVMEQRLTDDKPKLTDLSDRNRPTKLAERYSELYDSEWTDAFEHLDKIYSDEKKSIKMLTVILTEAVCFCRNEADEQMENLRKILTLQTSLSASRGQDVPIVINKQLKNSRKIMSELAGQNIVETYITRLQQLTSDSARDALRVEKFLRKAFTLCWLMSIQDPPVVFDRLLQHGEKFNTELYRSYTQTGPLVDFPVWPTMFLHEGGPVLSKGVAQGCSLTNE